MLYTRGKYACGCVCVVVAKFLRVNVQGRLDVFCYVDRFFVSCQLKAGLNHHLIQTSYDLLPVRTTYSNSLEPGPKLLRPWNLAFRTDFGLPGMVDPFDFHTLLECVLTQGLLGCATWSLNMCCNNLQSLILDHAKVFDRS